MALSYTLVLQLLPFMLLSSMALADYYGRFSILAHSHRLFTEYTGQLFESEHWQKYVDTSETQKNLEKSDIQAESADAILNIIDWKTGLASGRIDRGDLEKGLSKHVLSAYQATQIFVDMVATTTAGAAVILVRLFQVPSEHSPLGVETYKILIVGLLIYIFMGVMTGWRARQCFLSNSPFTTSYPDMVGCRYMIKHRVWLFVLFNLGTIFIVVGIEITLP